MLATRFGHVGQKRCRKIISLHVIFKVVALFIWFVQVKMNKCLHLTYIQYLIWYNDIFLYSNMNILYYYIISLHLTVHKEPRFCSYLTFFSLCRSPRPPLFPSPLPHCRDLRQGGSPALVPEEDGSLQECQRTELPHQVTCACKRCCISFRLKMFFLRLGCRECRLDWFCSMLIEISYCRGVGWSLPLRLWFSMLTSSSKSCGTSLDNLSFFVCSALIDSRWYL